jgi:hypothetical protein
LNTKKKHRNLIGFDRYSMVGSDEEGDYSLDIFPIMLDDDAVYQCQVGPSRSEFFPFIFHNQCFNVVLSFIYI